MNLAYTSTSLDPSEKVSEAGLSEWSEQVCCLISDAVSSAAFFTCLSDIESFGTRWILAVPDRYWNLSLKHHAFDELGHTQTVLNVSRFLRSTLSDEDLIKEAKLQFRIQNAMEKYFSSLCMRTFRPIRKKLGEDWFFPAYVLVSFLIERRLMKIYPVLAKHSPFPEVQVMAAQLIQDEKKHLSHLNEDLTESLSLSGLTRESIVAVEETIAQEWMSHLLTAQNEVVYG